jgi:hypothetical protein
MGGETARFNSLIAGIRGRHGVSVRGVDKLIWIPMCLMLCHGIRV